MFALMNNVINMKKVEINIRKLSVAFLGRKKNKNTLAYMNKVITLG